MIASFFFAVIAGVLSILSPCVLPLLPIVLSGAASRHRFGQLALAIGLAGSFVAIGLFVALVGFGIGLDLAFFRSFAALLMVVFGAVLMVPSLQTRLATAAGPVGNWAEQRFGGGVGGDSWRGQLLLGVLLGAVWSPCVGPTLGAASLMASRGENLGQVFLTMLAFGLGAAAPFLLLGYMSRDFVQRWRGRMMEAGSALKSIMGGSLLLVGLAILTGLDKRIETSLVELSPTWLTRLTTSI